jgi:PPOX class probable F420-dependent enzyme
MPAKLAPDEVDAFLDSKPGWIVLSTIGKDGYPHAVPIGYFRLGDEIVMGCVDGTQKVRNVQRNPRVALSLESGSSMGDIKGVVIQGDARVVNDPKEKLHYAREGARRRGVPEGELPTESRPTSAYIVVKRRRVISWDYARPA